MSLKNIYYIMRHGESEANTRGLIISSPERGTSSYGLTPNLHRSIEHLDKAEIRKLIPHKPFCLRELS